MMFSSLASVALLNAMFLGAAPRDAAQEAATPTAQSGRPLVFLFGADWCPACRIMKDRTLPEVERRGGLRGVDFSYVDVDRQPTFSRRYLRGNAVPQLVRFDHDGERWKASYLIGAHSTDRVAQFLATETSEATARYSSYRRQDETP